MRPVMLFTALMFFYHSSFAQDSTDKKIKAMSISFKNQMTPQLQNSFFLYPATPFLTIKIDL